MEGGGQPSVRAILHVLSSISTEFAGAVGCYQDDQPGAFAAVAALLFWYCCRV